MIERIDTPAGRRYRNTESRRVVASVTTVLGAVGKPHLPPWAAKVEREWVLKNPPGATLGKYRCIELLERAGEIGTMVHEAIEGYLLHRRPSPVTLPIPAAQRAFDAWVGWRFGKRTFEVESLEAFVWNEEYGYAGTYDGIIRLDVDGVDRRFLVDWKTSSGIHLDHKIQNAAYRYALPPDPDLWGLLVRLPKKPGDDVEELAIPPSDFPRYFDLFLAAQKLWEATQQEAA